MSAGLLNPSPVVSQQGYSTLVLQGHSVCHGSELFLALTEWGLKKALGVRVL